MVALLAVAVAMFLVSTAMFELQRHVRRPVRRVDEPRAAGEGSTAAPTTAAPTLCGEALFATGLDPETVLLDCLVGLGTGNEAVHVPLQPVALRVRHSDQQATELLSSILRSWADSGDRVFVELSFGRSRCRASLWCGDRSMTVAIDNGGDVWPTAPSAPRHRAGVSQERRSAKKRSDDG
jgi:hypothetical protein